MIANIHWIIEKCVENKQPLYMCFIDYAKAFDTVMHEQMWMVLEELGFPTHMTDLLRSLYTNQSLTVRLHMVTQTGLILGREFAKAALRRRFCLTSTLNA